jgi:integrase
MKEQEQAATATSDNEEDDMALKRIAPHLWKKRQAKSGEISIHYYARFRCRLKRKPRQIPLGSDLKVARDQLAKLLAKNIDRYDFDSEREQAKIRAQEKLRDGKATPFTFAEWAAKYPQLTEVKHKRSLADDLRILRLHLVPHFGALLLTDIKREALRRYLDQRLAEPIIRGKKGGSKKLTSHGCVSNELSLLRHMLRLANTEGYAVAVPSFDGLIERSQRAGRALTEEEQQKVLAAFDPWMRRLSIVGLETSVSQGDLLRLTESQIDERLGVITLEGGRLKTGVETVAPLTDRCRQVLAEIRAERKAGRIVPNLNQLVFTRDDGTPITRDHIHTQVRKALTATGIKKFRFHDYRSTALSQWARRGVPVEVAMLASGHSSVQMHNRYVHLQPTDIAKAFGTALECDSGVNDRGVETGAVSK